MEKATLNGSAAKGVGMWLLAWWDCGFELRLRENEKEGETLEKKAN